MTINVRTKGQQGEREIQAILNKIVATVRAEQGKEPLAKIDELFQRNQNQSAVGGSDLSCPFPLEIEIKRQEQLSINTWWKQCVSSAERTKGYPILIFRQSRKPWRVIMYADLPINAPSSQDYACLSKCRVEITMDTFKEWFRQFYKWGGYDF